MQLRLKALVNRIRYDAERVSGGAQRLASSAAQVAVTTQQLARNAEAQRDAADRMASAVMERSDSIQEVAVSVRTSQAKAEVELGAQQAGENAAAARYLSTTAEDAARTARELYAVAEGPSHHMTYFKS